MPMTHLPETRAGIQLRAGLQLELPARVATKFALVSSASFQRENMADDEDAIYYYKNNDVYNIYLKTSRSTKLSNHSAPFTPDSSVE